MNEMFQTFSTSGLTLAPLVPVPVLIGITAVLAVLILFSLIRRARSTLWRTIPLLVLLVAVANPRLVVEERRSLPDIVAIVVDQSDSQKINDRPAQTAAALSALRTQLEKNPSIEVRIETIDQGTNPDEGTRLFAGLERMQADIPRRRLAGIIALTDGQIADIPDAKAAAALGAPLHTLLSGKPNEYDRRLIVEQAPAFGLIDTTVTVVVRIDDNNPTTGGSATLTLRRDGGAPELLSVPLNRPYPLTIPIEHGGPTVLELEAEAGPDELSMVNNRAVVSISGIRDRLRVLLISGRPHVGERNWRNLLKADAGVDLVHFTILRPANKNDMTPLNELALIVFPMRELFEEKLKDFDLVIFDRFEDRLLPDDYYDRLAAYVRRGGALLVSGNSEASQEAWNSETGLSSVLPALATGERLAQAFLPTPSLLGQRHPITAGLPGSETTPPGWGRWVHQEQAVFQDGEVLLTGASNQPLLLVRRVENGRVGQVLSDTIWLWARGFEGGGPYSELMRRLAHWLMKEPELEEESLHAEILGNHLTVQARSLSENFPPVSVTTPNGTTLSIPLTEQSPGLHGGSIAVSELGLYRISDGTRTTAVAYGALNALEMANLRATDQSLRPVAEASGGGIFWMQDGLPTLRMTSGMGKTSGSDWLGLVHRNESEVSALHEAPLLPGLVLLLGALGGFIWTWWREGRS